ncbi:MAG: Lrp/AsnC family transcriptional regulator [Flavobacteriaceae bacterium]|nr:Lrp/AsnC family transcriptional regulator [Flavobacteriaceae bacterium]
MIFDNIDKKILDYLQKDSKITTKELSAHLNLSNTAIYERVKKLEKNGVIKKYVALIDKEKIDKSFIVFCQIKLVQHKHEYVNKFEREVVDFEEVLECFNVSGAYDYILKIVVKNMKAYHDFLNNKLTTLDHISSTHSTFIMNEVKNTSLINV